MDFVPRLFLNVSYDQEERVWLSVKPETMNWKKNLVLGLKFEADWG